MITTLVRRVVGVAALTFASLLVVPAVAAETASVPAQAAAMSCPTVHWGSLPKQAQPGNAAVLTGVRAGRHACFDRLVLDLKGPRTGYDVRYVGAVHREGVGTVVPTRGAAVIQVVVQAAGYDGAGRPTYAPPRSGEVVSTAGYQTFRQVAWGGSFEGQTTLALGVRARLPMRVFVLSGPGNGSRLVIDVAHHW